MRDLRPLGDTDRLEWLRLIRSENVGPVTFHALMARFHSAGNALAALPDLARQGGGRRIRICPRDAAEREVEAVARLGGRLVALSEPGYPPLLATIDDAPPILSVIGRDSLLAEPVIAIVGARNGSANGIRFARSLARDLGRAGFVIVSGLARGIDGAAHRGALESGTVAVMAGGVDVIYPRENEDLYAQVTEAGAVISEQPLGLRPQARHFPFRNRLVSGLATATVVVEATLQSGSLITARLAGEQGREVLAVPGNPLDARARGTNKLIREGASLIEGADDVLEVVAGVAHAPVAEPVVTPFIAPRGDAEEDDSAFAEARECIARLLGAAPAGIDGIVRESGLSPPVVATVLLELELAGRLQRHPGGQVSLAFGG